MPWWVLAFFVGTQAVAIYFSLRAYKHLAAGVDGTTTFVLGAFAKRERFTTEGWRYRNRALVIGFFGLLASVLLWWASGTLT